LEALPVYIKLPEKPPMPNNPSEKGCDDNIPITPSLDNREPATFFTTYL
jgi:hypothetical protein